MDALKVNPNECRLPALIGVGGIGAGQFFALNANHTLGREESRLGHFLDRRDYCKLHIIAHYVKRLLGTACEVIPIGRVGQDDVGRGLIEEMRAEGLNLAHVRALPGVQTLFSFCFLYPDGSGGNLTTDDSACARLDAAGVLEAEPDFVRFKGRGAALAAPEAPLAARAALLELATKYGFFRAASFNSMEIREPEAKALLARVDLLAINLDEAAAASGQRSDAQPAHIVQQAVAALTAIQPNIRLSITGGKAGSWSWDGKKVTHVPVYPVEVASTAGAGDAHMAGMLAGLAAGLTVPEAQVLATLNAALSVTSPHTIHKGIDRQGLQALADKARPAVPAGVSHLLRGEINR